MILCYVINGSVIYIKSEVNAPGGSDAAIDKISKRPCGFKE